MFLKNYVGDWPIKEYLKQHFTNQRNYQHAKSVKGKGKGKDIAIKDIFNFGSDKDSGDKMGEEENRGS